MPTQTPSGGDGEASGQRPAAPGALAEALGVELRQGVGGDVGARGPALPHVADHAVGVVGVAACAHPIGQCPRGAALSHVAERAVGEVHVPALVADPAAGALRPHASALHASALHANALHASALHANALAAAGLAASGKLLDGCSDHAHVLRYARHRPRSTAHRRRRCHAHLRHLRRRRTGHAAAITRGSTPAHVAECPIREVAVSTGCTYPVLCGTRCSTFTHVADRTVGVVHVPALRAGPVALPWRGPR
mmetsp:Transcript_5279/g.10739  ORF Transcript_5279/g.10739 Transcript_5279/m.10739 type:complete len:251 (+) Transcript_5279:105-857(+)